MVHYIFVITVNTSFRRYRKFGKYRNGGNEEEYEYKGYCEHRKIVSGRYGKGKKIKNKLKLGVQYSKIQVELGAK